MPVISCAIMQKNPTDGMSSIAAFHGQKMLTASRNTKERSRGPASIGRGFNDQAVTSYRGSGGEVVKSYFEFSATQVVDIKRSDLLSRH